MRSLVRRIRRYAVSLDALIAQLLDLSRLSCGKVEVVAEPIDLARVVEEVAHDARLLTRGKPVTVTASCSVGAVESDPLRLRQILNNLVTNAARATQAGRIAIGGRRDGDWLILTVSDTGCGISPDKHAAIFDAFEQVGTQTPGESGIGLGLAIVRQLVEVLGGDVLVESTVGAGSTFTVRLPSWRPSRAPSTARSDDVELREGEDADAEPLAAGADGDSCVASSPSLAGGSASAL